MVLGGMVLKPASLEQRATSKLQADELGLVVKHVGEYTKHAAAKNAGFQKGDILVSVEGIHGTMTESRLIGELLRQHPSKGSAEVIVVRDGKRIPLTLPIQ
jgi:type II secretory pathway component PulC